MEGIAGGWRTPCSEGEEVAVFEDGGKKGKKKSALCTCERALGVFATPSPRVKVTFVSVSSQELAGEAGPAGHGGAEDVSRC